MGLRKSKALLVINPYRIVSYLVLASSICGSIYGFWRHSVATEAEINGLRVGMLQYEEQMRREREAKEEYRQATMALSNLYQQREKEAQNAKRTIDIGDIDSLNATIGRLLADTQAHSERIRAASGATAATSGASGHESATVQAHNNR